MTALLKNGDWSSVGRTVFMDPGDETGTTAAVQQFLDDLAGVTGDSPAEPVVRALLARSVRRLHLLCTGLLNRNYPRLTRPPLNLQVEELLSAVVERLIKALEQAKPPTVRQFFALANQHLRWELNDLARRLDKQTPDVALNEALIAAPADSGSGLSQDAVRMLTAIDRLPEEDREAFSLVRMQGMTQNEAANILGVSLKTVRRRLDRSLVLLDEMLHDLRPVERLAGDGEYSKLN